MQALGMIWGDLDPFTQDSEEVCTALREPVHFGARLLFNLWRERQAKGGLVVGRDLPSRELACVLRNLVLYEPLENGRDFRVRLAGAALLRRFGRDITGQRLSDLFDARRFENRRGDMARMLRDGGHFSLDVKLKKAARTILHFELVGVPVQASEGVGTLALCGIFYHDWAR